MKNIEAKLRITADLDKVMAALKLLRKDITSVHTEAAKPGAGTPFKPMRDGITSVSQQLAQAKTQLLGFLGLTAGTAGVAALTRLADGYVAVNARLRLVTKGQQEFSAAQAQSAALARDYQQPLADTAALYTRVLRAIQPLGGGTREAQAATEALLASLKINGATASESASAILQFSQALGSGALRGEEFNAIAEAAPPLLDALAKGLGKPRDELKSLAEQGKLSTNAIVAALSKELPNLRRAAAEIPATIGSAALQARDAMAQLVGKSAEASESVRIVIGLLKLLAENLEPILKTLGGLAILIGAIKLAVFAQGLATTGAAAAAGATGLAAFGLAIRGILGALTGPVGLIVLVGSLAVAWLGLDAAKSKTQVRTPERLRAERDAVAAEVAQLDAELQRQLRENRLGVSPQVANEAYLARARLARLDAEIAAKQAKARDDARRADIAGYGEQNTASLRNPSGVREFESDNKTMLATAKDFADKRAAYVVAKDREIALARLSGDRDLEKRLLQEKAGALAQQRTREVEALRAFTKDEQLTRLAQVKDLYDQSVDLLRDALAREAKLNEEAFAQGLRDAATYLAERARVEGTQATTEIAELEQRLLKLRAALASNERLPTAGLDANARQQRQEGLLQQTEDIARLEADIVKRKRDQVDAERARLGVARQFTVELSRQRQLLDVQLAESRGLDLTPDQIRQRVIGQFRDQLDAAKKLGGDQQPVFKLIDIEVTRQQLAQVEREFSRTTAALQGKEASIKQDAVAGRITEADAERLVLDLRREQLPVLDGIIDRMAVLVQSPEEVQKVEQYRQTVKVLKDYRAALDQVARSAAIDSLSTALTNIMTGAKSAKDALLDMVKSFLGAMLNALNRRLAEGLVNQFLEALKAAGSGSGGGNGAGSWWATLLKVFGAMFHTGGVVGATSGAGRAVDPSVFAFALRYHSGGVAGLRPNEVPSILMAGEEVLTADDPRHVRNFRGGGVTMNTSVTINGAQGDAQSQRAQVNGLAQLMQTTIEQWAADQRRQGGILAGR